ncbi:glycosyltransferase [Desulfoscipio gibsoniae]|uniref:glycosyltransferase n=1 Tax=Desulfoscipio gibsoniae TaxID=102134 RepID=UPI0002DB87B8|nr:glycosyltransferase [Desulfoscipio gibsoniae]
MTNEIWPATSGGIGRLITETSIELSRNSIIPVILLENMDKPTIQAFRDYALANIPNAKVYSVEELLAKEGDIIPLWAFHFSFYHRSYKIAMALHKLAAIEQIDGIEFPDYLGLGYVFIKMRRLWKKDNIFSIPVWVRLHGTKELVDKADDREEFWLESLHVYDMERYSLKHADFLIAPSQGVAKWYLAEYKINKKYFYNAPKFQKLTDGGIHPRQYASREQKQILFYGKLQPVKGPDLFVKAAVEFLDKVDNDAQFVIIGQDYHIFRKHKTIKEELLSLIPDKYKEKIIFTGRIKPEMLKEYTSKCHIAVIPSRMETFCLAAHELNWIGIPLILNDIPAFQDYFINDIDCLKFNGTHVNLYQTLAKFYTQKQHLKWNAKEINTNQKDLYAKALEYKQEPTNTCSSSGTPMVSVIVPYFNMQKYIKQTVNSVFSQTYSNWELIIVDDGSTQVEAKAELDNLRSLYRDNKKVRIIEKENGGLGSARNHGIKYSKGSYILPLDSDDIIHPKYLELGVRALENNPDLAAVSCYVNFFNDGEEPTSIIDYVIPYDLNEVMITCENRAGVATSLFRKDIFSFISYDESLFSYEDWDLWWSLAEKNYQVEVMPEILFHYRRRKASMVNTIGRSNHAYLLTKIAQKHPDLLKRVCLTSYCYFVYGNKETLFYKDQLDKILMSRTFKIISYFGKLLYKVLGYKK